MKALSLNPHKYKLPCRRTLGGRILDELHDEIEEEKKLVLGGLPSVMMVDEWKNKVTNQELLVVTSRNENTLQTFLMLLTS